MPLNNVILPLVLFPVRLPSQALIFKRRGLMDEGERVREVEYYCLILIVKLFNKKYAS